MKKEIILLFYVVIVLYACAPQDIETTPQETVVARQIDDSTPIQLNCVLTPEIVRDVCNIGDLGGIELVDHRYEPPGSANDLRGLHICSLNTKEVYGAGDTRLSVPSFSTFLPYGALRIPLGLKRGEIQSYEDFKNSEISFLRERHQDFRHQDVPHLGDRAFLIDRPASIPWHGDITDAEEADWRNFYLYAEQDNILYSLEFVKEGQLHRWDGYAETDLRVVPLCSVDEAVELMRIVFDRAVTRAGEVRQTTQEISGCIITPKLIGEKCHLNLKKEMELSSMNLNYVCRVSVETISSAAFSVASFEEIATEYENIFLGEGTFTRTFEEIIPPGATPISGLGDQAVLSTGAEGTSLYFRVGERIGKFSADSLRGEGEEVILYDPGQQKDIPIGGACNLEEAQEIVREVLVPYLEGR